MLCNISSSDVDSPDGAGHAEAFEDGHSVGYTVTTVEYNACCPTGCIAIEYRQQETQVEEWRILEEGRRRRWQRYAQGKDSLYTHVQRRYIKRVEEYLRCQIAVTSRVERCLCQ